MKRLKIFFLFLLVFVLVLSGFVSAACDSTQAIVNLSGSSNAHASVYNGAVNYNYGICFNERFTTVSTNTGRVCGTNGGVIGLSALTNAHVENVLFTNYSDSFDVCYGNLACSLRVGTGGNVPCSSGEANIISISSLSNAHAAQLGDYNYTLCCSASGYEPICNNNNYCESGRGESASNCCDCVRGANPLCNYGGNVVPPAGAEIKSVYWTNGSIVAGNLERINNSYVNNSAYLVAYVGAGSDGVPVSFTIYENDTGGVYQNIATLSTSVQNGKAYVEWPITDADIAAGISGDSDGNEEFYFNASSGNSNMSSILYVKNTNGPNVAPVVNISSPADDSVYFVGENINFTSGSFDRDGRIASVQWGIGDTITNGEKSSSFFQHNYSTPGDKIVTLTVTDNEGVTTMTRVVVAVVARGINVHAKINKPYQGEEVFNYTIAYNGSGSWVISIGALFSGGSGPYMYSATCLGGNCPTNLGCPPTEASCLSITPGGGKGNYNSMNFSWTYGGDNFLINSQIGAANVTGARTYSGLGAKRIELNVSSSIASSKIYNDFTINEPTGCTADGLFFVDSSKIRWNTLIQTENICNLANPNCCPRVGDYACVLNATTTKTTCQAGVCNSFFTVGTTTAAITLCNHYNNVTETGSSTKQVQCTSDCAGAGRSTQQLNFIKSTYGLIVPGSQISNVRCAWTNNKCDVAFTSISGGGVIPPVETFSGCRETILSQSECTADNYQVVEWKSESIVPSQANDAVCVKSGTQTVLCGTPVIALPFFTLGNIIAAIILIVLIYLIISYSNKKKKNVKGKGKKRK